MTEDSTFKLSLQVSVDGKLASDGRPIYTWLGAGKDEKKLYVFMPADDYESNIALQVVNSEFYDHEQMLYQELVSRGWVKWCDTHKDYCSATFGSHVINGFEEMVRRDEKAAMWAGLIGGFMLLFGIYIGSLM